MLAAAPRCGPSSSSAPGGDIGPWYRAAAPDAGTGLVRAAGRMAAGQCGGGGAAVPQILRPLPEPARCGALRPVAEPGRLRAGRRLAGAVPRRPAVAEG